MPYQNSIITKRVEPLKTGELLAKEGLIGPDDIETALSIQEKRKTAMSLKKNRLFGMILCDLNLITPLDNYNVLHKYNKFITIESALVSTLNRSEQDVANAKTESQRLNIPFISHLLKTDRVSPNQMQKLLFDLFHIPFRPISDFVFDENDRKELIQVLDKDRSRENRIIPLVLKDNTLLFGITDPENILFIHKLNHQYPQYRFKMLFIPFSGFSWFYKIIYIDSENLDGSREKTLDLSLLLSFKTAIKHPEQEKDAIQILYNRYELLRHLIGNPKIDNRYQDFFEFVLQVHTDISLEYKSQQIEFSLKRDGRNVKLMAFPTNTG